MSKKNNGQEESIQSVPVQGQKVEVNLKNQTRGESGYLEGPGVKRVAVAVDEHPQGCQGDEEPAREGNKVDELVDLPGGYH